MERAKKRKFSCQKEKAVCPQADDYVFRFPLEPDKLKIVYEDPLLELVRGLLEDLLDCAILTFKGKRVRVDGFRLLQDLDTQYEIFSPPSSQKDTMKS